MIIDGYTYIRIIPAPLPAVLLRILGWLFCDSRGMWHLPPAWAHLDGPFRTVIEAEFSLVRLVYNDGAISPLAWSC